MVYGTLATITSEVFSKLIQFFLGCLILKIIFLIVKLDNFWGDLSDISAKTASLSITSMEKDKFRMKVSEQEFCKN